MNAYLAGVFAFLLTSGATLALIERGPAAEGADFDDDGDLLARASVAAPRWDGAGPLERPAWREGFAWRVLFAHNGNACVLAVVDASDEQYRQGMDCKSAEAFAVEDAIYDHAFMGRFDAGLAGLGNDEDVQPTRWFDWPLVDGKTWETELEDIDVEVTATAAPVKGVAGEEPGFELTMTYEGRILAEYDFVPSLAWWSELRYPQGEFTMRVTDFSADWRGEAVDATATPLLDQRALFLSAFPRTFEVDEKYDLLRFYRDYGGMFGGQIELRTPEGEVAFNEIQGLDGSPPRQEYLESEDGVWELRATGYTTGELRITIHGIDVTRHER